MAETNSGAVPIPDEITRLQEAAPTAAENFRRRGVRAGQRPSSPDASTEPASAELIAAEQPAGAEEPSTPEPGTPTAYVQDELDLGIPRLEEQSTSDSEPSTLTTYIQDELDLGIPKIGEQSNNPNTLSARLGRGLRRIAGFLENPERRTARKYIGDKIESAKQKHEEASKTAWYVGSAGTMSASVRREKPVAPATGESVTTIREQLSTRATQARERAGERLTKGLNTTKKMGRVAALGAGLTIALPFVAAAVGTEYVNRKTREVGADITTGVQNTYHQARVDANEEKRRATVARIEATEKVWDKRETVLKEKHAAAELELTEDVSAKSKKAIAAARNETERDAILQREQNRIDLLKAQQQLRLSELNATRASKVAPHRLRARGHYDSAAAHRGKIVKKATKASTAAAA